MLSIVNLVETTWLTRYPRPTEIMYDQGSEFIGPDFIKYLIEIEYGIVDKSSTLVDPKTSAVLEQIHQVMGNLVRTYNYIYIKRKQ